MSRLFAKGYDFFMSPLEKKQFQQIRKELLKRASGKVLELGSGTGINFRFYHGVEQVIATEPSKYMIQQSLSKLKQCVVPVSLVQASAENLPFEGNSFDTVVATLVFCTIPGVENAINEMKRVCKPGGKILLFEHVRMENAFLAKLQDLLTPVWRKICDGCCLDRNTMKIIQSHNISIVEMEQYFQGLFVCAEGLNEK